LLSSFP
jgi:glycogen synthase